ncbi:hypothetical protein [Streptomyces sp. XY332]|uniref:hypothetical protein n=1 Tax=Streptomyces sp. XY332 TaxID=1415561 RepID=UPI000B195C5D|nr:hypothetical protein [Streptomyces sp. XY332]
MTDAANTPPTTRTARVLTTVLVVIAVAYMGLMTFISVPELTDYMSGRDIDFPVFLAIAAIAGPALFWAYIGRPGSPSPAFSRPSRTGDSWPPPTATASPTGCSSP